MLSPRTLIIPFLHGKVGVDGQLVEPDIEAILESWFERHPQFRHLKSEFKIIRAATQLAEEGISTDLVRVTAAFSPDLASYDPADDADLYEEFPAERLDVPSEMRHKVWIEQCDAAEQIEADFGIEKALGYLIGEKLLNFLEVAETNPLWRAEVPQFVDKIKETYDAWQIAEFFEIPRRLGVLGHTADNEAHAAFRGELDESEKIREDARNLMLFEWARQLLLDRQAD